MAGYGGGRMDVTVAQLITQMIGTLGFPIVCCGALFWDRIKAEERRTKESELHRQEVAELQKSIEANTLAITTLCQHLGGGKNE